MFRSRNFLIFCGLAVTIALPCSLIAQDEPAAAAAEGFKLKPTVVVQEEVDEGTLTDQVSYFMGYNLMKNLTKQGQEIDKDMLFKGMKGAVEGPDQKSFVTGYQLMKNMQQQGQDIDKEMLFKGINAAIEGPDQKSFVAGYQLMKNMQQKGADLTLEKMFEGMNLATEGKELEMSGEQITAMMTSFGKLVEKQAMAKVKKKSDENSAATEAYMAKNGANPNVKKMENGVQYEVLVEGTGASPTKADRVKVDYHGTFLDGTVFDSTTKSPSGKPPKPAEFAVGGVVPGFSAALQAMKVGGKWRVIIPGEMGYGPAGRGKIGPNQALIFELSLLEIIKKPVVSNLPATK